MTFTLRTKILFPAAGVILVVVFASLAIINYVVRRQVLSNVAKDLARARQVFDELQERQIELLVERGLLVAETPYLKAAVETDDAGTVRRVAEDVYGTVHSDLLIITNRDGVVLAQIGEAPRLGPSFVPDSLQLHRTFSTAKVGLLPLATTLYRIVLVPIAANSPTGRGYLLGTAVFGNRLDQAYLDHFRTLTNSEIVLMRGDKILETTLAALKSYRQWQWHNADSAEATVMTINLDDEEYIVSPPAVAGSRDGRYALLRSVRAELDPLVQPLKEAIFSVAALSIILAIGMSYAMAHSLAAPVQKLVRATDAVSDGDYDHTIAVETKDEIGHLARKFDEMRQSLKRQMTQLAQRNIDLEETLRKLERTQAELVQSEKLAATGKITAQLSHELNNPIHNIRSCLEAARKKIVAGNPAAEFLDMAHEEVLRISKLLRQMLDFYRPQPTEREPVSLPPIVHEIIKSSGEILQQHRIRCKFEVPDQLPPVYGSRDQLKQVFLNLVLNAIDALTNGGELTIGGGEQNGWVHLSIADTGVGIPPENLDRIFDAFFTTKSKASGVGLGLSVSYGIVRGHGGRIDVESVPGRGSKFTVKLPAGNGR
jgi:signal transduction histidine kinase